MSYTRIVILSCLLTLVTHVSFSAETRSMKPHPPTGGASAMLPKDSLETVVNLISPTKDQFLLKKIYPIIPERLKPWIPQYPWEALGLTALKNWSYQLDAEGVKLYQKVIEQLTLELNPPPERDINHKLDAEKRYLIGDLLLTMALNGHSNLLPEASDAYEKAISLFPDAPYKTQAIYHLGLIKLQQRNFIEALKLIHTQEALWIKNPKVRAPFYDLTMEVYYLRGRYLRAEDYLWYLSSIINSEDLSPLLVFRFGNSLFWQGKYQEASDWFAKMILFFDKAATQSQKISRLYYAESLFQQDRFAEAKEQYELFLAHPTDRYPQEFVAYRLLQCQLARLDQKRDESGAIEFLQAVVKRSLDEWDDGERNDKREEMKRMNAAIAVIQWTRLTSLQRRASSDQDESLEPLKTLVARLLKLNLPEAVEQELIFCRGLLKWRMKNLGNALVDFSKLIPHPRIPIEDIPPLSLEASNAIATLMTEMAPVYWEKKKYKEYLALGDRYSKALESAPKKLQALIWISKAYLESGMASSSARLFRRLIDQFDLTHEQRDSLVLQLARAYALMGEKDLLRNILQSVKSPPSDLEGRHTYYMVHILDAVAHDEFKDCLHYTEALLQGGVRGHELLQLTLQGAVCARKAKNFQKAEDFISILGVNNDKMPPRDALSHEISALQQEALFEKINLLVAMGRASQGISLFEKVRSGKNGSTDESIKGPPLETIFFMVDAYRKAGQPDQAAELWKEYSERNKSLPESFVAQYANILDLLSQTELAPTSSLQ